MINIVTSIFLILNVAAMIWVNTKIEGAWPASLNGFVVGLLFSELMKGQKT